MKNFYWVPLQGYTTCGTQPMHTVRAARLATAKTAFHILGVKFNRTIEHYVRDNDAVVFLLDRQMDHQVWAFPGGDVLLELLLEERDLVEFKLLYPELSYARQRVIADKGPQPPTSRANHF